MRIPCLDTITTCAKMRSEGARREGVEREGEENEGNLSRGRVGIREDEGRICSPKRARKSSSLDSPGIGEVRERESSRELKMKKTEAMNKTAND